LAAVIEVPDFAAEFSPWASLQSLPLAVALALPFGPLGEEVGWREVTGITGIMTLVYYNTGRSVLIAVLQHLTFNISDGVLLDGLPDLTTPVRRGMYVVNVGLILLAGIVALGCLTLQRRATHPDTLVR
jgi:membrane protease YdiL (CAAX protease family)